MSHLYNLIINNENQAESDKNTGQIQDFLTGGSNVEKGGGGEVGGGLYFIQNHLRYIIGLQMGVRANSLNTTKTQTFFHVISIFYRGFLKLWITGCKCESLQLLRSFPGVV